jgi:hypothetical protein
VAPCLVEKVTAHFRMLDCLDCHNSLEGWARAADWVEMVELAQAEDCVKALVTANMAKVVTDNMF